MFLGTLPSKHILTIAVASSINPVNDTTHQGHDSGD